MCLVISKKHFSNFYDDFSTASKVFDAAMKVGEKIKNSLEPRGVFFSIIQSQVPHFHIRVYPVYEDQIPLLENKPIEMTPEELKKLAEKIKSAEVSWNEDEEIKKEEEETEKEPRPKKEMSEEDLFWMRRSMEIG